MKNAIACCGLNCEKCDAYIATIHNDNALREKTAKLWTELNHVPITAEMINCLGCRADGVKTPFCEHMCEIRRCVLEKGFDTCGACAEMAHCETLSMITATNADAIANLKNR